MPSAITRRRLGLLAVVSSAVYVLSDVIEAAQGGFSTAQLILTLLAEGSLPIVFLGLYAVQRPAISRLGAVAAAGYAAAYVCFTATVVYALATGTPDYDALVDDLGPAMTVPGVLMVVAGVAFAVETARARVLPRWAAGTFAVGVVLVAATQDAPGAVLTAAAAVRALGVAGLGAALLRPALPAGPRPRRAPAPPPPPAPAARPTSAAPAATRRTPP